MRHAALLLLAASLTAAEPPETRIANNQIKANLYLPDPVNGYYRGTRFDWSGQISSLEWKDHQFFGQWFDKYDPKLHDAIMGPVEEFLTGDTALGYDEAKPGGTFVRIGVGAVRRPDESAYQRFNTYDIVDPGRRSVRQGPDWIEFTHTLASDTGYGYVYTKTVRLTKGKPEMTLEHSLRNTGTKPIETSQYNHNFFVIDHQTTGPDMVIRFPFDVKPKLDLKGLAQVADRNLTYTADLEKGQSTFTEMAGYGSTPADYDIRIENRKSGAGVRIRGDQPLQKMVFWSIRTVACPEPYILLNIAPGSEAKWKVTYDFYELPK